MATTKLGLPTISDNMSADVVRDMNALAQAVDSKVASSAELQSAGTAIQGQISTLSQEVTSHKADNAIHVTQAKQDIWNGKQDVLPVQQKRTIYIQTAAPTTPQENDIWIEV